MADITITAANVLQGDNARIQNGFAGATITAGQVVYLDAADQRFKLADSDSATVAARAPVGFAMNGASAGQPLGVQTFGSLTIGGTLTPGVTYYLSDEPGAICPFADLATGDFPVSVGIAKTASVLTIGFAAATAAL
jgi:hypothetical protein